MKVIDLINQLNKIGYNKNTELTFSYMDESGECYDMKFIEICFGKDLTGLPYDNDIIDIGVKFNSSSFVTDKTQDKINNLVDDINTVLDNYKK